MEARMQFYMSLASHTLGFLGVIIVEAENPSDALTKAREITPDVMSAACEIKGGVVTKPYEAKWLNRLITKPEVFEIADSVRGVNKTEVYH
jgi:hypothetical protein